MPVIKEVEKIIAELPPEKASILKSWLVGLETTRCYKKKLEAYAMAIKALTNFEKNNSSSSWN